MNSPRNQQFLTQLYVTSRHIHCAAYYYSHIVLHIVGTQNFFFAIRRFHYREGELTRQAMYI